MAIGWRHARLITLGGLVLHAAFAAAQVPARPELEGYVFRDIDGTPLPRQDDAWIEETLANGRVVRQRDIPVGITNPRQLELEHGGVRVHASLKEIDRTEHNKRDRGPGGKVIYREWRDWYGYDIAAYRLDRLLGLDRVPPTIERRVGRSRGAVSIWIEGTISEAERRARGIDPPDIARFNQQKQILRVFDNLTANRDSNHGNALIDGSWRIWFIDFSRAFGTEDDLIYPEAVTHCSRALLQALRDLDRDEAMAALSDYLSRDEVAALLARRDKLVAHIEQLIAEQGESMILFDDRPPTATAPWMDD